MLKSARVYLALGLTSVAIAGCKQAGQLSAAESVQDDPKAVEFLKHSMDVYAAMPGLTADYQFTVTTQGQVPTRENRTIQYQRPNRFSVVSKSSNGFVQTSISNGAALLEYDNLGKQPPRKLPAPDSIAEVGTIQLVNPMFCGTLLFQFFGGAGNYARLVDATKGPVTFGAEEATTTGEPGRIVKFYAQQQYGHVEALIGEKSGYVYRIRYDSEPLIKMLQNPAALAKIRADAGSRFSAPKDARTKSETQSALSSPGAGVDVSIQSEELYDKVTVAEKLAPNTFALVPPKGAKVEDLSGASHKPIGK